MKVLIAMLAGMSALCEIYGTWTVWTSYRRTSLVAAQVEQTMEAAWQDDERQAHRPDRNLTRVFKGPIDPGSIRQDRRQILSAIGTITTPLLRDPVVELGLAAYVLGAVLGFLAVLVALLWT